MSLHAWGSLTPAVWELSSAWISPSLAAGSRIAASKPIVSGGFAPQSTSQSKTVCSWERTWRSVAKFGEGIVSVALHTQLSVSDSIGLTCPA